MATRSSRPRPDDRGQILALFALGLVAILALAALLYTGGSALVKRRSLQDAGDAAALAAASVLQKGTASICTSDRVLAPTGDLWLAALNSLAINVPEWGLSASDPAGAATRVTVTCPSEAVYQDAAVKVQLNDAIAGVFGAGTMPVATTSVAVNGQIEMGDISVSLLNPSNPNWSNSVNGCDSFDISGGVTIWLEGSVMVDSTCTNARSPKAAMNASNSALRMYLLNGAKVRIGGEYGLGTQNYVNPVPIQYHRPLLPDPLSGLVRPCSSHDTAPYACLGSNTSLPAKSELDAGKVTGVCPKSGGAYINPCILTPGTYDGGLAASCSGPQVLALRPGVYYLYGGGMQESGTCGGGVAIFAIPAGDATTGYTDAMALADFSTSNVANWTARFGALCPQPSKENPTPATCGVLIYNAAAGSAWSSPTSKDQISVAAGTNLYLRAYNPDNDTIVANRTTFRSYKNVTIWQARQPAPTGGNNNSNQPMISMQGGGCVTLSGTVYAAFGQVSFGGSPCGSAGDNTTCPSVVGGVIVPNCVPVQFIAFDLFLNGNSSLYFAYQKDFFAVPTSYGLVCDPSSTGDCPAGP